MPVNEAKEPVLVSYLTLRRTVGVLGVSLPILLALWSLLNRIGLLDSISDYYSLRTRDVFVGIFFTIGWFLFAYQGYEKQDDVTGNLAYVFSLGVTLFPNSGTHFESVVHFTSALALFLVLSYFSLALFTKTSGSPTPNKLIRNHIYVACGVIMLVCIALIGVCYWFLSAETRATLKPVFWLETFAL